MDTVSFKDLPMSNLVPERVYLSGDTGNYTRDEPIQRIFKFDGYRGIGNMGGIRRTMLHPSNGSSEEEAFIVLVNSGAQLNWPNVYDTASGILTYHGDNQKPGRDHLSTKQAGNKAFIKYFRRSYEGFGEHIVPFFYFEKLTDGSVKYIGLAVPYVEGLDASEALTLERFNENQTGEDFENLVGRFTVLRTTVTREWLLDLKHGKIDSENAPVEWLRFLAERAFDPHVEPFQVQSLNHNKKKVKMESIGYRMASFRKTQGRFRRELLKRNDCCELCGMAVEPLLVASHIIPWSVADEHQRQDPDNGLLLCVTHDALFDKGFITFEDDGRILISEMFPRQEWQRLSIDETMHLSHIPRNKAYMHLHRANIFKTSSR